MLATIFSLSVLSLILPFVAADNHGHIGRHHSGVSRRASGDIQLHKRFDNARFTYYEVGLGACGITNVPSDFIVALNSDQYGTGYPGPQCFKMISITVNGKTATAQITDECPGCPYAGLDMSEGLFQYFAPLSVGVLYGTWNFIGDTPPPPTTSAWVPPPPPPTTTHKTSTPPPPPPPPPSTSSKPTTTWKPTTTSTWSPPPSSSSSSKPSSSSTTTSSSSSSSTSTTSSAPATTTVVSSVNLSSGAASGLAVATAGAVPENAESGSGPAQGENLNELNYAIIDLSALIAAAGGSS